MADKAISKICIELGSIACQRGDYMLTYMLYNRSFASNDDEENLVLADSLKRIGNLYAIQRRFKEARKFLMKALTICRGMSAVGRNQLRDILDDLGELSHKQGNFSRAIHYYQRAMEIEESLSEKDAAKRDGRLNQIAWLQLRQGQIIEAQTTHSRISRTEVSPVRSH